MLNTDAVINFRGEGSELESVLKKLGVGFSKLNDGVSDNIDYVSTLGKESSIAEKLLGKMSGAVGKTGLAIGGLGDAYGDVSDSVKATNSALKASVKITDVTGNWAIQTGAKFLGLGKQVSFLNNTLGPVADSFTAVMEQGTVAGKIFKTIDIAQKPLSNGLRVAAKATEDLADKFESLGFMGQAVAQTLDKVSGGLLNFSKAVNISDKIGDVYRLGEGIKEFAENDLPGLMTATGTGLTTITQQVSGLVDTPMKIATVSARAITTSYGSLTKNTKLLQEVLETVGSKGASAIRLLGQGMEKLKLPPTITTQTTKLADGLEDVTGKSSKAGRALNNLGESFQKQQLNNIAGKFLGILVLKQSIDMLQALGKAAMDAYMKLQGINTAFSAMQSLGIDTTSMEIANSIGMIGEGFLLSSQAAEKFVTTSFQKFAGLQDQLANLATLSVGAAAGQEQLGEALTQLVNGPLKNAISSVEAAKGMYNALSAGVGTIGETAKFMEAATKLSSATGAEAGTTIEALAKSMKVYKIENRDSALVAAKMNAVVERGIVTFPQLAGGIARVSESAKASGVKMDELYGSIAALTQTLSADDAMTGYASLLSSIAGQGAQSAKAIEELGIKFDTNTIKSKGLIESLQDLWKATGGSTNKLKEIIPDSLAFSTALSLMTTASANATQNMKDMGNIGEESLDELFNNRRQSAAQRMTAVTNGFNEVMIDLGKRTLPAIEPGLKYLEGLLGYFQKLPDPIKDLIAGSAMLSMQFGRIGEASQSLINIIMGVGKAYLFTRATQLVMSGEWRKHIGVIQLAIRENKGYGKAISDLLGVQQVATAAQQGQMAATVGLKAANDAVANSFGNARKALEQWGNQFPIFQSAQYKAMLPAKNFDRMVDSYKTLGGALKNLSKEGVGAVAELGKVTGKTEALYKSLYATSSPEIQGKVNGLVQTLKNFDPVVAKGDVAKAIGLGGVKDSMKEVEGAEKRLKEFRRNILEKYPETTPLRVSLEAEAKAIERNLATRKELLKTNRGMASALDDAIGEMDKTQRSRAKLDGEAILGGKKEDIQREIKETFASSSPVIKTETEKLGKQIAATSKKGGGVVGQLLGFDAIQGNVESVKAAQAKLAELKPTLPQTPQFLGEVAAIESNLAARKKLLAFRAIEVEKMNEQVDSIGKKQMGLAGVSKEALRQSDASLTLLGQKSNLKSELMSKIFLGGSRSDIQKEIASNFANASPAIQRESEKLRKQITATAASNKTKGAVASMLGFDRIEGTIESVKAAQDKLAAMKPALSQTPQLMAETAAIESNLAARAKLLALRELEEQKVTEEISEIGASIAATNADTAALATNDAMSNLRLATTGRVTLATQLGALANAVYSGSVWVVTEALKSAKVAAIAFWVSMGPLVLVGAALAGVFLILQDFIPALGGAAAEGEKAEKAFLKAAGALDTLTEAQKEGVKEGKKYKGFLQSTIWLITGTISNIYNFGKWVVEFTAGIFNVAGALDVIFKPIGEMFTWFEGRARESVTIIQELTEAATTPQSLIDARIAANKEVERSFNKTLAYRQKLKDNDYITDEAKKIVAANQGKALSEKQLTRILELEKKAIDGLKASNDKQIASYEEAIKLENDPARREGMQDRIKDLKEQTSALSEGQKAAELYQTNLAAIVGAQMDNNAGASTEKFLDSLNKKTKDGLANLQKLDEERIAKMRRDGQSEEVIQKAEADAVKTQQVYQDSMTKFGVFTKQMANAASSGQRRQLNALSNTYDKLNQDLANVGKVDLSVLRGNADAAMDQIKQSFDGGAIGAKLANDLLQELQNMKGPIGANGVAESILSAQQAQELTNMRIAIKKTELEQSFQLEEKHIGDIKLLEKQTIISAEESALRITEIQYKQNQKRLENEKEALKLIEKEGKGKDSQEYLDRVAAITKMEQELKGQQIEMGQQEIAARRSVLDQKLRLDEQSSRQVQLLQTKGLITAQESADQQLSIDIEMNEKRLLFAAETLEKIAKLQGKNSKAYMDQQFEINKIEIELETQRTNRETKRKIVEIEKNQKIFSNQIETENQGLRTQLNALSKISDELGRQQKVLESRNALLALVETQSQASLNNLSRQIKDEVTKAEIQSRSAAQQLQILERTQEAERVNLELSQEQQRIANEKQQIDSDIALKENQRAIADAEADIAKQKANEKLTTEDERAGELRVNALRIQREQLENQQSQLRGQMEIMENAREELVIKQQMAKTEAEINLLLAEQAEAEARRNQEVKARQQMLGYYQQQISMVSKLTSSEVLKATIEARSQIASLAFLERKQELEKESAKDQERINALALERQEQDISLQLKENERLINQSNLQLTQATNAEEQEMAQARIQSLQKQREFISGQADMIGRQQEMNERAAIELEIRQDQEKSEAKLGVLIAKQAEEAAKVNEQMNRQKETMERQKQLAESRSSYINGELDLLARTVTREKDKQEIARATARLKYQSLIKQQEMELKLLDLNQAQQRATMEQEQIRLRMHQAQNKADIADAKAKVSESIAGGDSPMMVQARLDALQAKVEQGAYLQYATEIQSNQIRIKEALDAQQREITVSSQATARGNVQVDIAETLTGRQRNQALLQVRNQTAANLGLDPSYSSGGLGFSARMGLRGMNFAGIGSDVVPQVAAPNLEAIRRNFAAQMQEFAVPRGEAGVQGRRTDPALQQIQDTLQAQAERPTNDVSMQNTINITLPSGGAREVGQNVEQQVLNSLDNVLTTLNQRR